MPTPLPNLAPPVPLMVRVFNKESPLVGLKYKVGVEVLFTTIEEVEEPLINPVPAVVPVRVSVLPPRLKNAPLLIVKLLVARFDVKTG